MTDYHISFNLNTGNSIDVFAAGNSPAGKNLPCDKLGDANAGSPDSVMLSRSAVITDVFFGCTSGAVELIANGTNTGIIFRAAHCQATQAGRMKFAVGLTAGVQYRFKVVSAIPA